MHRVVGHMTSSIWPHNASLSCFSVNTVSAILDSIHREVRQSGDVRPDLKRRVTYDPQQMPLGHPIFMYMYSLQCLADIFYY